MLKYLFIILIFTFEVGCALKENHPTTIRTRTLLLDTLTSTFTSTITPTITQTPLPDYLSYRIFVGDQECNLVPKTKEFRIISLYADCPDQIFMTIGLTTWIKIMANDSSLEISPISEDDEAYDSVREYAKFAISILGNDSGEFGCKLPYTINANDLVICGAHTLKYPVVVFIKAERQYIPITPTAMNSYFNLPKPPVMPSFPPPPGP